MSSPQGTEPQLELSRTINVRVSKFNEERRLVAGGPRFQALVADFMDAFNEAASLCEFSALYLGATTDTTLDGYSAWPLHVLEE